MAQVRLLPHRQLARALIVFPVILIQTAECEPMDQLKSSSFSARIVNCLQTILELEPMLRRIDTGHLLLSEFKVLKSFLNEMDSIELDEDDVARIEVATERFLQELKTPVELAGDDTTQNVILH